VKFIDIVLIVLLIIGGYRGYKKGLLLEVIAIIALILAIIGGFKLMQWGMHVLTDQFHFTGKLIPVVSFILIFVAIILLVNIIGHILRKVVHLTLLGGLDSVAGSIVGILKWAFGLSVLLWFFSAIGFTVPPHISENTFVYPKVFDFAPKVIGYLSSLFPFLGEMMSNLGAYFK